MLKFLEHFTSIREALATLGMWDEQDGLYYDQLTTPQGTVPIKVRSMVGIIPLLAAITLDQEVVGSRPDPRQGRGQVDRRSRRA